MHTFHYEPRMMQTSRYAVIRNSWIAEAEYIGVKYWAGRLSRTKDITIHTDYARDSPSVRIEC